MFLVYNSFLSYIKSRGYSTYRLRQQKLLSETTLQRMRKGAPVSESSLTALCKELHITPAELSTATNKTFTIIAGLNGSGKSSLTGPIKYERKDLGEIVDVNRLTKECDGDFYEAGQKAMSTMERCIQQGLNFTQETTLAGAYTRRVAKAAKLAGYMVRMYYVGIDSEEESLRRIKNRVEKGGHDIPAEDVHRRWQNRISALHKILPYCDEVAFFDNVNGFVEVGQMKNGVYTSTIPDTPMWLKVML